MIGSKCRSVLGTLVFVFLGCSSIPAVAQDLFVGAGGGIRAYDSATGEDFGIFNADPLGHSPNALAFSPSGVLYGLSVRGGDKINPPEARFIRYDGSGVGTELRNDLDFGSGPTATLVIDSVGRLLVGHNDGWIYRFDPDGQLLDSFVSVSGGVPTALAIDRNGCLFTASSGGWVQKFSSLGEEIASAYIADCWILGLAVDSAGNLYVARNMSMSQSNVEKYSPSLVDLGSVADFGPIIKLGQILGNLDVDANGNLYIVNNGGLAVAGGYIAKVDAVGNRTIFASDLEQPFAMAIRKASPGQQILNVGSAIEVLVDDGVLSPGDANSLITKLDGAFAMLENGLPDVAVNRLESFVNQVSALVRSSRLTEAEGEALIDAVHAVITQLLG